MSILWYDKPASTFMYGLPVGTGRLKAMVFGAVPLERIALNHEWLWRGLYTTREPDKSAQLLPEVRKLLLEGKYEEGTVKGNDAFAGGGGAIRKQKPGRVDPYQPAGDLYFSIKHGAVTKYRRELDIHTAVATVQYEADRIKFRREILAHLGCDLILMRLSSNEPATTTLWLSRAEDQGCFLHHLLAPDLLAMDGLFDGGMGFRVEVRIIRHDGQEMVIDNQLVIAGATEIILSINIGTSAFGGVPVHECAKYPLPNRSWAELKESHIAAYRSKLGALSLRIEGITAVDLPTNERLARLHEGQPDSGLILLSFNYARYLHVAATATAELPPNLQGGWNDDIKPPWECDYHTNINMQLNYWLAEPAGLHSGIQALVRFVERFIPHARKCAKDLYGCRGVCFPLQTDPWGRATPESYGWAAWTGAASWLAQHLWWHYEYNLDAEFLRQRAYPFFKEIAAFYEDYLIEDENGVLQIVPSQSPENRFAGSGKLAVSLCVSATMDIQLVQSALGYAIRSAEILGIDSDSRQRWETMRAKLPPYQVGSLGQLLEWNEEFEERDVNHRHFSHLFGIYPADLITPEGTPDLFAAARISLARRLTDPTRGHVGWRLAWAALLHTRFGDRAAAWHWLNQLVACYAEIDHMNEPHHSPLFQIEGMQGCTATICEMLLQSWHEELHLLPCLPDAWPCGEIKDLRARGGHTLDIAWENGVLKQAVIRPSVSRRCTLIHAETYQVQDEAGNPVQTNREGHRLGFDAVSGKTYFVQRG